MQPECRTVDRIIAAVASAAHGIVTRIELLAAGVTEREIKQRVMRGSLLPVFRGVYRVGHAAPSDEAYFMAAVKACGVDAVLSGLAAAYLWDLIRGARPRAEVTCRTERHIEGVRTRRCRDLDPRDCDEWRRIPVTSVARTLVDLAALLDTEALAQAFHQAHVRYRTTPGDVEAVLARRPTSPGAAALRRVVQGDSALLLSRMEKRFRLLLKRNRLPLPDTNHRIGTRYTDCRWPAYRLTVELDSYRFHATRHAWELDHKREREAYARGDQFRRYAYADIYEDPTAMLRELRELLLGQSFLTLGR